MHEAGEGFSAKVPAMTSESLVFSEDKHSPVLVALGDGTPICDGVNLGVHIEDEMWRLFYFGGGQDLNESVALYFLSGWEVWSTYRRILAWRFGDLRRISRLLDFASGYGRVTRFIVHELPPERVWVADIYAEGVRFQQERFGVHGIVSTADPEDFSCDERFDAILVSSLFSHLPEAAFHAWLRRLWGLLAPEGVLVFSVHDEALLPPGREMPEGGILFQEQSESRSLSKTQYGTAWVNESFVRKAVAEAAPGASVARFQRGFTNLQDLYVVVDRPGEGFSGLDASGRPEGFLEHCGFSPPDRVALGGWGLDRVTGKALKDVRARLDGREVPQIVELRERPEVAALYPEERFEPVGWDISFRLPPGTDRFATVVTVAATDARGRERILFEGPLQAALLRSVRLGVIYCHKDQARERAHHAAELDRLRKEAEAEATALRNRIAAMEASRFWKLRNLWFALKRRLGLTREL